MSQRKTQTATYWQKEFSIGPDDIEFISSRISEQNRILSLEDISLALVARHIETEEASVADVPEDGRIYRPQESYQVGDTVVFAHMGYAIGTVQAVDQGQHPEYGTYAIIAVSFHNGRVVKRFAADLAQHALNHAPEQGAVQPPGLFPPEDLYRAYRHIINRKVRAGLATNRNFVEFHEQYYLNNLLAEFHEGLFNIADAAIDINQGPMPVDTLIQQMELTNGSNISDTLRFSVNYRLAEDDRFDQVGPAGQVMWYLERLEPQEVNFPPPRLRVEGDQSYDPTEFDDDLLDILAIIDDDTIDPDDLPTFDPTVDSVSIVLNYPSWRSGTMPLTPKTDILLPSNPYNPVRFDFVDGRTGDAFPGWTIQSHGYVFGLGDWYHNNKLPVGAYIDLKRTDDPLRVVIDYRPARAKRDWVRMVKVTGNNLTFQMGTSAVNCEYDELMIIGDATPADTDKLWERFENQNTSVFDILKKVFPELSKLNPQSTVHAKTLYSGVNVLRRISPGVIFQELVSRRCFVPMNHGYWTYDPSLED